MGATRIGQNTTTKIEKKYMRQDNIAIVLVALIASTQHYDQLYSETTYYVK